LLIHCNRKTDEENSRPIDGSAIVVAVPSKVISADAPIRAARTRGGSPSAAIRDVGRVLTLEGCRSLNKAVPREEPVRTHAAGN
jgi:hypothetical protein